MRCSEGGGVVLVPAGSIYVRSVQAFPFLTFSSPTQDGWTGDEHAEHTGVHADTHKRARAHTHTHTHTHTYTPNRDFVTSLVFLT